METGDDLIPSYVDFLQEWLPGGPWSVGCIDPNTNDHAWLTSEDPAEVSQFVEQWQSACRNIYVQLNVCRELGTARASKSDVAAVVCVAAEVDPPATVTTPEALAEWQGATADQWSDPSYWAGKSLPVPSLLVFSGSGFQAAWRLREDVVLLSVSDGALVVDREAISRVEDANRGICRAVDGDTASTGVERLLRLPGTTNYPGDSKVKKGRTGPVPSELMFLDVSSTHDLVAFPVVVRDIVAPSEIPAFDGLPPPEKMAEAAELLAEDWPDNGRHNAFLALSGGLAQAGWPAEAVEAFTVAVAQRMTDSDEKAIRDRAVMARQTVDKVLSGMVVKSWGTLVAEHEVEPAVLRRVQNLLGIPDQAPQRDDAFFEKLLADHKYVEPGSGPPTDLQYDAAIRAAANSRSRSSDPVEQAEREVLRRVLDGRAPWDDGASDTAASTALLNAAILLVRVAPDQSTQAQHERRLLSSSGRLAPELTEIVTTAVAHVRDASRQDAATEYERNSDQQIVPVSVQNFGIASARLKWEFKYNSFADRKLFRVDGGAWELLQDRHLNELRWQIKEVEDFLVPEKEVWNLATLFAHRSSYHPVNNYLDGLTSWDGAPRVGGDDHPSWLTTYCGVKDSPYVRAIGRLLLCAAVRRVRRPGCKFDEMVILEGPQGGGKSSLWRALCPDPEWFTDDFSLK